MRQVKTLARTFLILSIVKFALAAPVAVRERPEVHLHADVTRNVEAVSQKRLYSDDEGELPLPDLPWLDYPPSPTPEDLTDILAQIPSTGRPSPTPDSPGSSSVHVPMNLDHPSPELTDILAQIPSTDRPSPTPDSPWLSSGHVPTNLDHPSPELTEILSQMAYTDEPPATPDTGSIPNSPGSSPESHSMWEPVPSPGHATSGSTQVWSQITELVKQLDTPPSTPESMPVAGPLSPPPPPPHSSQPGPSEDRFQGQPLTYLSTGNQPKPPQSPGVDPETHSLLNQETFPAGFWEDFLKGKIKRRMLSSDAVNLAKKDPRSRIF